MGHRKPIAWIYASVNRVEARFNCPQCYVTSYETGGLSERRKIKCPNCGHSEEDRRRGTLHEQAMEAEYYVLNQMPVDSAKPMAAGELVEGTTRFLDRAIVKKMLKSAKPHDHLVVMSLTQTWVSGVDFLETVARLVKIPVYIHVVNEKVNLSTTSGREVAACLENLANFFELEKTRKYSHTHISPQRREATAQMFREYRRKRWHPTRIMNDLNDRGIMNPYTEKPWTLTTTERWLNPDKRKGRKRKKKKKPPPNTEQTPPATDTTERRPKIRLPKHVKPGRIAKLVKIARAVSPGVATGEILAVQRFLAAPFSVTPGETQTPGDDSSADQTHQGNGAPAESSAESRPEEPGHPPQQGPTVVSG